MTELLPPATRRRRGIAIVLVLVAMTVLGVAAAGTHFAALRSSRDSRDALRRARVLAAAEYGLHHALTPAEWRAPWATISERGLLATQVHYLEGGVVDTVRTWKLTSNAFLVTSDAVHGAGPLRARRRLGLLVSLVAPTLTPMAAATAREHVSVADGSSISGNDASVSQWSCPPPAHPLPAVAAADEAMVTMHDCDSQSCLTGSASILATPRAAESDAYEDFGVASRADLAARVVPLAPGASIHVPTPSLDTQGACDTVSPRNLGDPLRTLGHHSPCANHIFLGHALGDLRISGGAGHALLIVDGDLTLDTGTQFFGAVFVRGTLRLSGSAHLTGVALATRITLDGGSRIDYSRCAMDLALHAAALPTVPPGPAWVELH
jgi:hypothetical protein